MEMHFSEEYDEAIYSIFISGENCLDIKLNCVLLSVYIELLCNKSIQKKEKFKTGFDSLLLKRCLIYYQYFLFEICIL